ncbi:hypothetical protein A1O1_04303 [Capronia coronata CBS 617.96]|uniref:RGS domain-containing protein n=1 Tax=Capronia coronata CBS 617.96 TaxID=1182541 RepID=W9Z9K1_9EURO|nr:uncharacterized protein A1O1_04303 [Capronia coronata CBS 617.96]EXJ91194.1 hypothetical protein A1O1_04303 [Capronia coronata CBS 617.96]
MVRILPAWLHWYQKPSYRDPKTFTQTANAAIEDSHGSRAPSISSQSDTAIPADLSLERVLTNRTCSPLSLYDFYMYLKHIELSPENLEFLIWFRDYQARYDEDKEAGVSDPATRLLKLSDEKSGTYTSYAGVAPGEESDLERNNEETEFVRYIESLVPSQDLSVWKRCRPFFSRPSETSDRTLANYSNFEELQQMSLLFLVPGAPKELNLPASMRTRALSDMQKSDSPQVLAPIADHIYYLLKNCSHRNFIRLGVKNGTFETLCMVTIVGILFTTLGLLTMLLLAFASPSIHHSVRWRGIAAAPFWFVGVSFLFAGWRGSCFLLLLFSRRQELPWERVDSLEQGATPKRPNALVRFVRKLMLFERKIRVKDQGLRVLQRKIVIQSMIGALVVTIILEVVFLCLPIWK